MKVSKLLVRALFLLLFTAANSDAQVATLYSAEGVVEAQLSGAGWQQIEPGQELSANDAIRTGAASRAALRFSEGYLVRLGQKSQIKVTPRNNEIDLDQGKGYFFSRKPKTFPTVRTPQVSASVRGTEFVVESARDQTEISVLDGVVLAANDQGQLELSAGERAVTKSGQAPTKQIIIDSAESVQWAIYYPAITDISDFSDALSGATAQQQEGFAAIAEGDLEQAKSLFPGSSWRDVFARAAIAYQEGNIPGAIKMLEQERFANASILSLKAALLLAAGEVETLDPLLAKLEAAIAQAPQDAQPRLTSSLNSKRAIVALARNKKDDAATFTDQAVESTDPSISGYLVSSYLAQANNDIPLAISWLEKGVEKNPSSTIINARLAEMYLASGKRDKAREYIAKALKVDQSSALALIIQGFIELTASNTELARESFDLALNRDGSQALGYLGKGLALIKEGELAEGRSLLEQAAHIDPLVSLYRSYLAKAYYEEDRYDLSDNEIERAIELDPEDPTPYLYRAYSHLTQHRPVQALRDIQSSIERNDNRAVFRSRLLLDQDQGTRSTGLGKIYQQVGFLELARVEAMKALQKDYANYSAHFLLGDLYQGTHLNSRAQSTENIIGRLFVPVTYNSANLNIGGSAGLNEYSTLFDRPVERVDISGFGDTVTDSLGSQVSYTGVGKSYGYKLGYSTSYRSGFRENDWERNNQLFAQGQYQLDESSTIVADQAVTFNDKGDLIVNHDPYLENEEFERNLDSYLARVGYRREVGVRGNILAQVLYNYGEFDEEDLSNRSRASLLQVTSAGAPSSDPFYIDTLTAQRFAYDQHLLRTDLQYIWENELVSVVTGVAGRYEDNQGKENSSITSVDESGLGFLPGTALFSEADVSQHEHRGYLYSTWHLLSWFDLTTGVSYSKLTLSENATDAPFVDSDYSKDAFDPKIGFVANLTPTTALRASFTESLDRTGRGGIDSIEPTSVGGFNQVFDGVPGSEQQLWAIGVDQTITENSYSGISYQRRDLKLRVPELRGGVSYDRDTTSVAQATFPDFVSGEAEIERVSFYYYQILNDNFTATLDYAWEFFEEDSVFPATDTTRVTPRINYFSESGMFAFAQSVFRYQERGGELTPRSYNDFWMFDLGMGYQFSKRRGAVTLTFNNILDKSYRYSPITDEALLYPDFGAELDITLNF